MASPGVRHLRVLGEFEPYGLTVEKMDGKPSDPRTEKYDYFLFDPEVARERDDLHLAASSQETPTADADHELFIRGNRIIWSTGSRIHKRFTCPNPVLMACWCRMDAISDALLCVLQLDTLSIYTASGEVVSIPLPYAVASIWPLQFGLLLQKSMDANRPVSTSSSLLNARDLSRPSREYGSNSYSSYQLNSFEHVTKEDGTMISSHLFLKHPLEELQATYVEERGKWSPMNDIEERTIWTCDFIPLVASYHKGKLQHSLWFLEMLSNPEAANLIDELQCEQSKPHVAFRRIWQGKCAQSAASKVFMATDADGTPIVCFLLEEQKLLLAIRLQIDSGYDETVDDIRALMSWTITAIAAAPVIVTRPRVKVGILPFNDIVALTPENILLLYSGNQCLCKYLFPIGSENVLASRGKPLSEMVGPSFDLKIVGVANAVKGRVNVTFSNGQMFRCALRSNSSSALVNDCVTAMAEGLHYSLYNHFALLLWGESNSGYLATTYCNIDSEWEALNSLILKICRKYCPSPPVDPSTSHDNAWEFLKNSKFHMEYCKHAPISGFFSTSGVCSRGTDYTSAAYTKDGQCREISLYAQLLKETLDSLHALYENLKLDNLRKGDVRLLAVLLTNVAASLGESSYVDYYVRDFPNVLQELCSFHCSFSPKTPPCLFKWLEDCLQLGCHMANMNDLPPLVRKDRSNVVSWARKIVCFYSLLLGAERVGKKLSSGVYYKIARGLARTREELTVLAMVAERFGRQQLDMLPVGVSLPLRHALDKCRESPPTDWSAAAYVLVGREDLAMACLGFSFKAKDHESQSNSNLISLSTPYMLHLQPVTVPSSASDIVKVDGMKSEDRDPVDRCTEDGMEHIFNSSTHLRYGCDLRLNEVKRLLCSAKPVAIHTSVNPSASDQELQQHQLWNFAQRTTTLPFGRGAFTLATTCTLLTEPLAVPKFVLAGRLPSQQNATVNLDPNIRSISELITWPEFHNGVAAGLRLAPFQAEMSRTWIQYNKPEEPNVTHAGLLLALGLHEHLRVLTITDVYKYLSQEHDITTVGILLGMAASYRGTMHPAVSKMLYIHIPSGYPSSFAELELPTLMQSAALMGIGLLYEGSAHPLTMKILLGEIGHRSGGDNVLEREGYAVAAGSALGLVALGRGKDAFGFTESFVDRLIQYTGCRLGYNEKFLTIGKAIDEHNRIGQMMDGTHINVDVTAPGATIALGLIFLKTESEVMASRLHIPQTYFDLQYVRPDFIILRIIARNLIMWSRVQPSRDWIESQIPEIIKSGISTLSDEASDFDEIDAQALVQAYVNIVAGACITLGLKYAGTRSGDAQELLYNYALHFLNEIKHVSVSSVNGLPNGLSRHVDRGTLELCLHLIVLALSVIMAGSGHLQTLRLLRYLRIRSSAEGHTNYGIQMTVSLAIGFLFLGGGRQTFSTGNSSIAALLITLYPRLPTGPNDNRCHLQVFRHLYAIAAESRFVQTVDVDTGLPVYAPLEVTITETDQYVETSFCEVTPCLLPERCVLKAVRVCGPRYWPQSIQLLPEDKPWWRPGDKNDPFNGGLLYIKRKVGSCSYVDDPIGCQSLLSRAMHKVCDASYQNSTLSEVDQLVSSFSANPSLVAFAQLCCDSSWNGSSRSGSDFQEFCSQVLFECVSKDRPDLLQVYLLFYTMIGSMWEQVKSGHLVFHDSLFLSSFKLAFAYSEALVNGKLTSMRGGAIHSTFMESLRKRIEEILTYSPLLKDNFRNYLDLGQWPKEDQDGGKMDAMLLSWYLQWFSIPAPHIVKSAMDKIKLNNPTATSMVPLLRLLMPAVHIKTLFGIDQLNLCEKRMQS